MGDNVRDCVGCGFGRDYPGDNKLGCKGAEGVEVEGAGRGVGEVLK